MKYVFIKQQFFQCSLILPKYNKTPNILSGKKKVWTSATKILHGQESLIIIKNRQGSNFQQQNRNNLIMKKFLKRSLSVITQNANTNANKNANKNIQIQPSCSSSSLLSSKKETTRTTKQVSFRSKKYYTIPNRYELDCDEIWYTQNQLQANKDEIKDIVKVMRYGFSSDEIERRGYCVRGLEKKDPKIMYWVMLSRTDGRDAVFHEQSKRSSSFPSSSSSSTSRVKAIAESYGQVCEPCVLQARQRALRDEEDAEKIYEDDDLYAIVWDSRICASAE